MLQTVPYIRWFTLEKWTASQSTESHSLASWNTLARSHCGLFHKWEKFIHASTLLFCTWRSPILHWGLYYSILLRYSAFHCLYALHGASSKAYACILGTSIIVYCCAGACLLICRVTQISFCRANYQGMPYHCSSPFIPAITKKVGECIGRVLLT